MNRKLETGIRHSFEKRVTFQESARQVGSGSLDLLSSPSMIAFMEKAALELVQPYLNEGDSTVGTEVNIRHIKPTPINSNVEFIATLTGIEGKRLTFSVEAKDEYGTIGTGKHERYIINEEIFMSKLSS